MIRHFCDWCKVETNPGHLSCIRWELVGAARKPISQRRGGDGVPHEGHNPTITLYSADICPDCKEFANLPVAEADARDKLAKFWSTLKDETLAKVSASDTKGK